MEQPELFEITETADTAAGAGCSAAPCSACLCDSIEWKDIPGFAGYKASKCGKIKHTGYYVYTGMYGQRRYVAPRVLKQTPTNGYRMVTLRSAGKTRENGTYKSTCKLVHRLVCETWHGAPPSIGHTHVNHIDGDRSHNCAYNLEWATPSENVQHAWDLGLRQKPKGQEREASPDPKCLK